MIHNFQLLLDVLSNVTENFVYVFLIALIYHTLESKIVPVLAEFEKTLLTAQSARKLFCNITIVRLSTVS